MSTLSQLLRKAAKPLPPINSASFAECFDWLGQYQCVLIGDASHGTSEFYHARAEITKRLISHHGFTVVALEADWPDAEAIDHYVRHWPKYPGMSGPLESPFKRFPAWMWRNLEVQNLVRWLREHNDGLAGKDDEKAGIYGLDLYSLGASMEAVINYLGDIDPEMAEEAKIRYARLRRWVGKEQQYGLQTRSAGFKSCEADVVGMLIELLKKRLEYSAKIHDGQRFHSAEQNAELVVDAEEYYRKMYYADEITWNLRDTHMFGTLKRLTEFKKKSKVVVWAHNSHVGDARHTDMGMRRGEINLGQLCRQHLPNVAIVGCGTHDGAVAAAHDWGGEMEIMSVNPSRDDSWERVAHDTGLSRFLVDMRKRHCDDKTRRQLEETRLERFIGVIYRPDTERWSHYSAAQLARQFDAYLFFNTTHAVTPLDHKQPLTPVAEAETYPFGL
jgi:erythromycin esterase-like protein